MKCGFCLQDITDAPFRDAKTGELYHTECTKFMDLIRSDEEFRNKLSEVLKASRDKAKQESSSSNIAQ